MHNSPRIGDIAPLFDAKTLDGKDLRLIDYRGKFVLLSFWQPVFHPEKQQLQELYDTYGGNRQLEIIGLGGNDTLEEVKNYVRENAIPWLQIYTGEEYKSGIAKDYGGFGIFLIDPDGRIIAKDLRGDKLMSVVSEAIEVANINKPDVQVETEKPQSLIFHGLDLTAVPHTTNFSRLPDLFEERPLGSKSYHIQKDVTAIYSGLDGTVYFIPRRNIFYVQHDKLGSSTLTYYGPFEGNPFQALNLQPDVQGEGKAGKLEFWIIPESLGSSGNPIDLSPQQVEQYFQSLQKNGPRTETQNTDYIWLELDENVESHSFLKKRYQGILYVLASNRKHEIMLDDGSWYVNFVDRQRDNNFAVRYHSVIAGFDEYGTHLFSSLTNNNIGKILAIVKDNKVIFASTIQRRMYQAAITGDFTEKQTASLMVMFGQYLQVQNKNEPFLWNLDRQTWREYIEATEALAKGRDRAKLAKTFLTIGSKHPQTTHCQTAIELGHLLESMVKEDKQFEEPEDVEALNQSKQVEYYIYKLRDVAEKDISVPGKIHFLRDYPRMDTPVTALRKMGKDVVPAMIKHLKDRRPTRSVGSLLNGGAVTRNCDVALEIIESIAGRKFDFRTRRGTYLSTASERLRDRIIKDVKQWWQKNKQQSGVQVEVEGR